MNKPLASRKKQQGVTGASVIGIVALVLFFALILIRLAPVYIEHFSVKDSLKSLAEEQKPGTPAQMRDKLQKRFSINQIERVKKEHVSFERKGRNYIVTVKYEARVPFISNIDFVASFEDSIEVQAN